MIEIIIMEIVALVIEGACTDKCVQSLISNNAPPSGIYVDQNLQSVLKYFMETYPANSNICALLVSGDCVYPPQLVSEYKVLYDSLNKTVAAKIPNTQGAVYGLGGIVMSIDRHRNNELEFQSLLNGATLDLCNERTIIGYHQNTAPVDYLEIPHTILIHRSYLDDNLSKYLGAMSPKSIASENIELTNVLLSNYFASRGVCRIQICNLIINRFMLTQGRCVPNADVRQSQIFIEAAAELRRLAMFCAW